MWETIELREIRVFLARAEELHFRRTDDRLGLTQSRVSQSLRSLEHKRALKLTHRTSRRVTLSPAGDRFHEEISGAYGELVAALRQTHEVGLAVAGELPRGAQRGGGRGAPARRHRCVRSRQRALRRAGRRALVRRSVRFAAAR